VPLENVKRNSRKNLTIAFLYQSVIIDFVRQSLTTLMADKHVIKNEG
jgi:hypothetical protein